MRLAFTSGAGDVDRKSMRRLLTGSLVLPLALLSIASGVPAATAAPEAELFAGDGAAVSLDHDPATRRTLAVWGRGVPDGHGFVSLDMYARMVDENGRPLAAARLIGSGGKPSLAFGGGGQMTAMATDSRRHRRLVAWAAHKPGMGRSPCATTLTPAQLVLFGPQPACERADTEIFVRLLDRNGRPLGGELQVSDIGPPDRGEFASAAPALAYDARSDSYLLVYAAAVTGDDTQGALFAQRIKRSGYPDGPPTRLALQPQSVSVAPVSRLIADPRGGYLLVYAWGAQQASRGLFAQRLTASGALAGGPVTLATTTGAGVGSFELAFDGQRRRALLVSSAGTPGSSDFTAQQLTTSGAPATSPVPVPAGIGNGNVRVAADTKGGGWTYAFVRDAPRLVSRVYVQRASASGRPLGRATAVTGPDDRASEPSLAATDRGTVVVGWADEPVTCKADACTGGGAGTVNVRLLRP
jgi:hypothetical protein